MRVMSLDAAPRRRAAVPKNVADLAADLIKAGYIFDDQYLEMKHLDPKWMVAIYIYAVALCRAFGGKPEPGSRPDRE